MKLTVLGSGTFLPTGGRNTSSYFIETRNDYKAIFDLGRGSIGALYKEGFEINQLDAIFISHTHEDHCSELVPLIMQTMSKASYEEKFLTTPLTIYGPKGLKKLVKKISKLFGYTLSKEQKKLVRIKELKDGERVTEKGVEVQAFKTIHSKSKTCFSYRIEADNKVLAYSGDSSDNKGLRKACEQADVALIEATLPNPKHGHLSAQLAATIAKESNVKHVLLTHVKWDYYKSGKALYEGRKIFGKNIHLAKDEMKIKV